MNNNSSKRREVSLSPLCHALKRENKIICRKQLQRGAFSLDKGGMCRYNSMLV